MNVTAAAKSGPIPAGRARSLQRMTRGRRVSDLVLTELTALIRDNTLAPGTLVSETELASQFGVSRTPVREAISQLVNQKLLKVVSQVGTQVAFIDVQEVAEAIFIRTSLEVAAFERARPRYNDSWDLRGILEELDQATTAQDSSAFFVADERLHSTIFAIAGFPNAWTVVRNAKVQLDRVRHLVLPDLLRTEQLKLEHTAIVRHLEGEGDLEAGRAVVIQHGSNVLDQIPEVRRRYPSYFEPVP